MAAEAWAVPSLFACRAYVDDNRFAAYGQRLTNRLVVIHVGSRRILLWARRGFIGNNRERVGEAAQPARWSQVQMRCGLIIPIAGRLTKRGASHIHSQPLRRLRHRYQPIENVAVRTEENLLDQAQDGRESPALRRGQVEKGNDPSPR